eukprot:TRINITY_DN59150_c0_g1_i1.p1 TRINITY_DN59150_c0_g1~~TRINITY_DN59150_c0_g1_i1.p1  ORF type:complete len:107 (-),score=15.22 TRINITY_DN59150_c0_g1_i1:34-354(-)
MIKEHIDQHLRDKDRKRTILTEVKSSMQWEILEPYIVPAVPVVLIVLFIIIFIIWRCCCNNKKKGETSETGPVAASPVTVTTASQFTVSQVLVKDLGYTELKEMGS